MPATYEPIATATFTGSTSEATFNSIPNTYTDLRLVFVGESASQGIAIQFNGDTGTNYSLTGLRGDGSAAYSYRNISIDRIVGGATIGTGTPIVITYDFLSYAGATYKTTLNTSSEDGNGTGTVRRTVGMWSSTSAITSIRLYGFSANNITGTATLYGIKAA